MTYLVTKPFATAIRRFAIGDQASDADLNMADGRPRASDWLRLGYVAPMKPAEEDPPDPES